jgi:hypothetical protein
VYLNNFTSGAMSRSEKQQQQRPRDNDDDIEDLPPAYSMPIASTAPPTPSPRAFKLIPGLPNLNFAAYAPATSSVSNDNTTVTFVDAQLCKSPQALAKFLTDQISIPPIPEIRIRGSHKGWSNEELDFDLRLNMLRYFVPPEGTNGLSYTRLVSQGSSKSPVQAGPTAPTSSVEQWAKVFCQEGGSEKRYVELSFRPEICISF